MAPKFMARPCSRVDNKMSLFVWLIVFLIMSPNKVKPTSLHKSSLMLYLALLNSSWRQVHARLQVMDLCILLLIHFTTSLSSLNGPCCCAYIMHRNCVGALIETLTRLAVEDIIRAAMTPSSDPCYVIFVAESRFLATCKVKTSSCIVAHAGRSHHLGLTLASETHNVVFAPATGS